MAQMTQYLLLIDKISQKFDPKLFRNIVLIFSLEKPCYLENRVVREPCKVRTAYIRKFAKIKDHVRTIATKI
jgi:hypothetical protein